MDLHQQEFDDDFLLNLTVFAAADHQNQNQNLPLLESLMTASTSSVVSDSCFSLEGPSNNSCLDDLLPIDDDRDGESGVGFKVVFRTKSDIDVMDDGFKWRKYGKKKVKNSPNPRLKYLY
ncbi:DNA-binding WRKY [Corchorus capsularis]|uniref:DNA-binding WRKY n=1 Tax=Corchorus capsularis TaxID=210143 RepID=A0A1R3J324_COCAP|nr:DNA-binding WRKY [Corchorus capsularis]